MNETQIKQLIEPTINKLGYSLESISLKREKGDLFLQIVVDRFDPISLDDIVAISNEISPILDENDPIKDNYFLDVTSLGAEKPIKLEHLDKYINKYVNLHVINPIKGENYLEGNIDSVNDDTLILSYKISLFISIANIIYMMFILFINLLYIMLKNRKTTIHKI